VIEDESPTPEGESASASQLIRSAATSDLPELLTVHREAFTGTRGVSLGNVYLRSFLRSFVVDPTALCLLAIRDRALVGYVLGEPVDNRRRSLRLAPAALFGFVTHPKVWWRPGTGRAVVGRVRSAGKGPEPEISALPSPAFALVGIGTSRREQGHGVGRALVDAFEREAMTRGYRSMQLSVYKENEVAVRLYEGSGWHSILDSGDALYYAKPL